jgi:hypothetical protein
MNLKTKDDINDRIWNINTRDFPENPHFCHLKKQGLIESGRWLPDLVGLKFGETDSLVVIGSAYSTFVFPNKNRKGRDFSFNSNNQRALDQVKGSLRKETWSEFQTQFYENVVCRDEIFDPKYYEKVFKFTVESKLAESCDHLALTEIVPIALVNHEGKGGDKALFPRRNFEQSYRAFLKLGEINLHNLKKRIVQSRNRENVGRVLLLVVCAT